MSGREIKGAEMKRHAIATALLLAAGTMQEAGASHAWRTGNDLARDCSTSQNYYSYGSCAGYLMGVADMMAQPEWPYPSARACFPDQAEGGQLIAIVKKYLAKHPEQLDDGAFRLVANALALAFPCPSR
jgi:Rap1a immunity proteins